MSNFNTFDELARIAPLIPTPVYWLDMQYVIRGANAACLSAIGSHDNNAQDVLIGKTYYDYYPKEIADELTKMIQTVMETKQATKTEEKIVDVTTGECRYYETGRAPLFDESGTMIGTICSAIEITDQKEAKALREEKKNTEIRLEEQEKFRTTAKQMIHDLTSPTSSIDTIVNRLQSIIPEADRITLRHATGRILGIAQRFLSAYENQEYNTDVPEELLVSLALIQIINELQEKHFNSGIQISSFIDPSANFKFIKMNTGIFKRMIVNLVNNAVDALLGRNDGKISLTFGNYGATDNIVIVIDDNGSGMPQHIQDKFNAGIAVTAGKAHGHGIGLTQVKDAVSSGNGAIKIEVIAVNSAAANATNVVQHIASGTTIRLIFPIIEMPAWITSEIQLNLGDIVIVLDDDNSIHGAWDSNFKAILAKIPSLQLKHYTDGNKLIDDLNNLTQVDKQNVFLLTDYELLEQTDNNGKPLTGLEVLKQTGIHRAVLVTSYSMYLDVQNEVVKLGIKLLPKELAANVQILVKRPIVKWSRRVDLVWVEDQQWFIDLLVNAYYSNLIIDTYNDPISFIEQVSQYPLDTRIVLDSYYTVQGVATTEVTDKLYITGYDLALELHEMGYSNIIIFTGQMPEEVSTNIDYIKVLYKSNEEHKQGLVSNLP